TAFYTLSLHDALPIWFRNTWSWGRDPRRPVLEACDNTLVHADHPTLGEYWFSACGQPTFLFTENETNFERLWGLPNTSPYVKDRSEERRVGKEGRGQW